MSLNSAALRAASAAIDAGMAQGHAHEVVVESGVQAYLQTIAPRKGVSPVENPHRQFHVALVDGEYVSAGGHEETNELYAGLHALCGVTHAAALNAGWYRDPHTGQEVVRNVPEMLMLIVSEVAEAMEGYRKRLMDDHLEDRIQVEVELADAVIRIGDLCGYLGLDLAGAVQAKMAYNAAREDHKLEVRAKGGKAF